MLACLGALSVGAAGGSAFLPRRALAPAAAGASNGGGSGGSGALQKGFGPCIGGVRDLYFYTDGPTTCPATKMLDVQMAENLDCNVRCPPGTFLSANKTTGADHKVKWQSTCEACPKGKFSMGGGQIYSGVGGAWKSFPEAPLEFHTHCLSRRGGRWVAAEHCAPWEAAANGTILSSGNNTGRVGNEATVSILTLNANFVRDGYIKYSFRVDAEECASWATEPGAKAKYEQSKGRRCGDGLDFVLDVDVVGQRYSYEPDWWFVKRKVPRGSHTLKWEYFKDASGDGGADRAEINLIEVVGTAHADLQCTACSFGNSGSAGAVGSSSAGGGAAVDADEDQDFEWDDLKYTNGGAISEHCASCEAPDKEGAFWYADDTDYKHPCIRCPVGRYSVPGKNVGWESCLPRPHCNLDDMVRNHSACDAEGKRRRFYTWAQPHTCIDSWEEEGKKVSMDLTTPKDAGNVLPCPACGTGYYTPPGAAAHSCAPCPAGSVRDVAVAKGSGTACTACAMGQVATRHLSVHAGSGQIEWNRWPTGFRVERALVNGWGLTAGGIASAGQHYSFDSDETLLLDAVVPEMTLPGEGDDGMADGGKRGASLEFEYEIQYLPSSAYSDSVVELTFSVNGRQHAVPGGRRAIADAVSWDAGEGVGKVVKVEVEGLPPGRLVLQWRWRRTSMPWGSPERMVLRSLTLNGTNLGGGASCASCPPGTQPDGERFGCAPCAPGTFSAAAGAACTPCAAKHVAGHGATKCIACGASMVPSADGAECVIGPISLAFGAAMRAQLTAAAASAGAGGGAGGSAVPAGQQPSRERKLQDWVSDRILDAVGASPSAAQRAAAAAPRTTQFDFDLKALGRLGAAGVFAHGGDMVQAVDATASSDDGAPPSKLLFLSPLARTRPTVGGTDVVGGAWVDGVWQPGRGTGGSNSTLIADPPMMMGGAYIVELVEHKGGGGAPKHASDAPPPPVRKRITGFGNALCRPRSVFGAKKQFARIVSVQPLADARSAEARRAAKMRVAGANASGTLRTVARGDRAAVGIVVTYRPMNMGAKGNFGSADETAELRLLCDAGAALGTTQPRFYGGTTPLRFEWRTAAACPICRPDFFKLQRTECIGGKRTELWVPVVPCYDDGTFTPGKERRFACSEVVVTKKMALWFTATLATLGALSLFLGIYLMYVRRKSRAMYSKYMQLKLNSKRDGSDGDGIIVSDEGAGQTSFEFNISDGTGIGSDDDDDDKGSEQLEMPEIHR